MKPDVQTILGYTILPALAMFAGGSIALVRIPGPKVRSAIQHFAAGVVFAAVATELIPEITAAEHLRFLVVGFLCGLGGMLAVNRAASMLEPGENGAGGQASGSAGLLVPVAIDVFVDGLLVGISFVAGARTGLMITFALTLELLFLGLATSSTMRGSGETPRTTLTALSILSCIVLASAALGSTVLADLSGAPLVGALAFATAALLYLVTEELLAEAHSIPDTAIATAMFFLGFLLLLVIDIITG